MRFLRPDMLQWLLLLPVLIACWMVQNHYLRRVSRAAPIAPRFLALSRRTRARTRAAMLAAALTFAGAMVFALARPQVLVAARNPEFERQDLIIVLDRSVSMRARDIAPSRLVRATLEIRNFLQHRPDAIDRVALVGFADSSLVLSYPTADVGSLFFYLDWIDDETTPLFGTNMGGALISALAVAHKDQRKTRKLFLLVSDGEDHGTELDTALGMFRSERIQVHCVGIGSSAAVTIPLRTPEGRESFLLDDEGRPIRTRFSESTLRRIAETTGGRYIRSSSGSEMAEAISTIVRGERKLVGWKTTTEYRDLYGAGLAAALVAGAALWLFL
jgi:Ca-activated chloride channel family protein